MKMEEEKQHKEEDIKKIAVFVDGCRGKGGKLTIEKDAIKCKLPLEKAD